MKNKFIIIGAIVLMAVGVLVISNKSKKEEFRNTEKTESEVSQEVQVVSGSSTVAVAPSQAAYVSQVVPFTVSGGNYYFKPDTIEVKQGDTVTITFKNDDGFHNLIIDEYKVATQMIKGGAEETVTFVADKKGSFEYYCSVGKHRLNGMKGTLIVK